MSDDLAGYFAGPAPARPVPPPPPPAFPPPISPPPIGRFGGGTPLPPGGRVVVAEPSYEEQLMLHQAALQSGVRMGGRPGHYPVGSKLGFFEKIGAGIDLAKTCWVVLKDEPTLVAVPFLTMLASAVVLAPLLLLGGGLVDPSSDRVLAAVQLFAIGVVLSVIGNVGMAVVVSVATTRLEGGQPQLATAWSAALAKLPQLAALGVLMALERAITSTLRQSPIGRFLAGLIDSTWDFASFLAVPVILFEGRGALGAVGRSGEIVVKRWGTQLTANALINLAVFVCALPVLVICFVVGSWLSPIIGLVLVCAAFIGAVAIAGALSGILSAAMYRYAVTGLVVPGFREQDMWRVFSRG